MLTITGMAADKYGRKPVYVLGLLGFLLQDIFMKFICQSIPHLTSCRPDTDYHSSLVPSNTTRLAHLGILTLYDHWRRGQG